jgi:hypothetical protein
MTSPPPALSEDLGMDKKRKREEAPILEGGVELFDLLDS